MLFVVCRLFVALCFVALVCPLFLVCGTLFAACCVSVFACFVSHCAGVCCLVHVVYRVCVFVFFC